MRQILVRVGEPARLRERAEYLTGLGCSVAVVDDDSVAVVLTAVPRRDAAELELDLYLRVFEARAGVRASRVNS